MRVVLVVPDFLSGTSFLQQPLDFLYTATVLERDGHKTSIVDCRVNHMSISNLVKRIAHEDVVVLTTTPCDQVQNYFLDYRYAYAVRTINAIKEIYPQKIVIACGAHITVRPDLAIKEINADYYVRGEIIYLLKDLVNALTNLSQMDAIPNIIYRDHDNVPIYTKIDEDMFHPHILEDTMPNYSKVPMGAYFGVTYENNVPIRKQNRAVAQGGRGCPFACSFCNNYFGKKINRRNFSLVADELEMCQKWYGVKEIFFLDEVFSLDKTWVYNLCEEIIKRRLSLEITIQTRVDCLDRDMLMVMKSAGISNIWLGVESADDDVLMLSNKGINFESTYKCITMIKDVGIAPNAFFMLGMPGETIETLNKTIRTIHDFKVPYTRSIMICTPRYGTEYYSLAQKQYPFIENDWFGLNAVKGLVANEMTPHLLLEAKSILQNRDFVYDSVCPQLKL